MLGDYCYCLKHKKTYTKKINKEKFLFCKICDGEIENDPLIRKTFFIPRSVITGLIDPDIPFFKEEFYKKLKDKK